MTLQTRRRIFYILVVAFFIIGAGVVGYAEGWRFDFSKWRLEKTGAIYIRSYPTDASIFLDGKPVQNQSGFLSPGTLISDLLPRNYQIALKASGYDPWRENAPVEPSLVVQLKSAVLVPASGTVVASATISLGASGAAGGEEATFASPKQFATLVGKIEAPTATDPYDPFITAKFSPTQGAIMIYDKSQATTTESIPVPGNNRTVSWINPSTVGVLQTNGELYLYDAGSRHLQKIADDVSSFSSSANGTMIAAIEWNSLEIFTLNDPSGYYRFNIPQPWLIRNALWYRDNSHLLLEYPNRVAFLDFADESLANLTTVAYGTTPYYDAAANMLYLINKSGSVTSYQFPQ